MKFDWLIVGAGYTGCVLAERIATQLGQRVLIVEKRDHIGGNAYDYFDENGVLVHKYGPHIFHTNSRKVWDYLSQFTDWTPYYHKVLAVVDGKKVPVPFNLNSLYALFPPKYAEKLENILITEYGFGVKVPILKLLESDISDLKGLAQYIYKNVFYGYTLKQWELKPEELSPSVTGRIPVYISRDDRYFQDTYQAMPKLGYTEMFRKMLNHRNIKVLLNTEYQEIKNEVQFSRMIYTGPIDAYFGYMFGKLPYRSLKFDFVQYSEEKYQEVAQVNYPNEYPFTRITEFKHMTGSQSKGTTIAIEYPQRYIEGENEPYYPIPKDEYQELYNKYLNEAKKLNGQVIFAGRLADYKYYNMDQVVARALHVFEKEICRNE
ncbi:UDP-galactopyranose mutase [Geobacillus thermoleovorans]|uniref:UDP-galactopyranose mutase n=1 Tax=Geobacillus thermoleovorans TaxID=33941 RepID=UPI003DA60B90